MTTTTTELAPALARIDKLEADVVNLHKLLADALDSLNSEREQTLRAFSALQRLVTQALPAQGCS